MAHVQDIEAGCRGAVALAGSTLAAACIFATGSPPLEPSAFCLEERRLGLGPRPATALASAGFFPELAESEFLRQLRPPRRIVSRDHRIIRRQVPFLAILRRRQAESRQVTPQHLVRFAVLQRDQKVRGDRLADGHRWRFSLNLRRRTFRPFFQPLNRRMNRFN